LQSRANTLPYPIFCSEVDTLVEKAQSLSVTDSLLLSSLSVATSLCVLRQPKAALDHLVKALQRHESTLRGDG
jgi:hypothetical protein